MKNRFNTYDIMCMVTELQRLIGMRVNQVYDIDNKTYVIRLQRSEEKSVLLLESGNRFHTTQFEWPKNVAPSGFTMKLRKHLKNKRLEKLSQLGIDRIVDLQFGSGEAAYHVILELYDRGNIVLTDCEWTILNVLRPHVEGDKVRFAVKEKYPLDRAKTSYEAPSAEALQEILANCKPGDNLKKVLNPNLEYGAAIIDHVLLENGLSGNLKISKEPGKGFNVEQDLDKLVKAMKQAEEMLDTAQTEVAKGFITQKKEERPNPDGEGSSYLLTNVEFHPKHFAQHQNMPCMEYETFDRAVDEFFSTLEGQKIDLKIEPASPPHETVDVKFSPSYETWSDFVMSSIEQPKDDAASVRSPSPTFEVDRLSSSGREYCSSPEWRNHTTDESSSESTTPPKVYSQNYKPPARATSRSLAECIAAVTSKKLTQRAAADYYNISRSTIKNKLAILNNKFTKSTRSIIRSQANIFKSRRYLDYTQDQLERCLRAIRSKQLTQKEASDLYDIPYSTIKAKLYQNNNKRPGRPTTFTTEEEALFVEHVTSLHDLGMPVSLTDVRIAIRDYLTSQNRIVEAFRNNIPGKDWLKAFVERHPSLRGLTHSRHKIRRILTSEIVVDFFETLSIELESVPLENIYMYDEIGLCDYPEKDAVAFRRPTRYPEAEEWTNYCVMFCGNAVGSVLPPYVVYRSERVWTKNGPPGARYNKTEDGWFDTESYEDWFLDHLLPKLKNKKGRKVVLGDHLCTHISGKVLAECEIHDITIRLLPPNSSHILQALDKAYFQPLQTVWHEVLADWKCVQVRNELNYTQYTPRVEFPHLLKKALNSLTNVKENILEGFRFSGISPFDVQGVLSKLPKRKRKRANQIQESLYNDYNYLDSSIDMNYSEENTFGYDDGVNKPKKLKQEFGHSLAFPSLPVNENSAYLVIVNKDDVLLSPINQKVNLNHRRSDINIGDFVVAYCGGVKCPAKVLATFEDAALLRWMKRGKMFWRWPVIANERLCRWDKIICSISPPTMIKRGCYMVPVLDEL
ncbi:nuclear export mediator factor NEMF homolog Clbn isoform X1 [Anticarsia gemmatalis]|uniref:nuclear export mediator factor NEMF homolog Clbn isoform X1 n=1 Tax=Anticarsia gemmatalis TaxID=129554 RepID=UPI003F7589BB